MNFMWRSRLRAFSGGAEKPTWAIPRSRLFGPRRADKHHYGEHATYGHFVLFMRGLRPAIENGLISTFSVLKNSALCVMTPVSRTVVKHNPDLRLQLVALASFAATSMTITGCYNDLYQKIVDITSLLEFRSASLYAKEGFWLTEEEYKERQEEFFNEQKSRIEEIWKMALEDATSKHCFQTLCSYLLVDQPSSSFNNNSLGFSPFRLSPQVPWRFDMMPYGEGNPDTQTFPVPSSEQPLRAFSLSFTSNNLSGNWGDYINRQDNKGSIMRPSRQMFTDVYIGPTK